MITFTFPQTAHEAYVMLVPVITLLMGLAFFIIPGRMLALLGVEAQSDKPEAKGVGRYLFASFMLASALCCLLVQEPTALQPGLNNVLGIAWILSAIGIALQIIVDGKRDAFTVCSSIMALIMGWIALSTVDSVGFAFPQIDQASVIIYAIGFVSFCSGLCFAVFPKRISTFFGLQESLENSGAYGALRGVPFGFMFGIGFWGLFYGDPPIASLFAQIIMGAGWIFVGIGLIVSMLFDAKFPKGFSKLRILMTIASIGMGSYCLLKIFGYL